MAQKRTTLLTLMRTLVNAVLACFSTRPGAALLSTPTVHLMTNVPTISPDMVVADCTEAAYTGYAAIALPTVAGPLRESDETESVTATVNFICPNPLTVTATVTGYYITDGAGTTLYGVELFDAPVPLVHPFDFLEIDVVLPMSCQVQLA